MGSHTNPADVSAVMDQLRVLVRALRASGTVVERGTGISGAQLFVLRQLAHRPAASMNELAARTSTHQSSVSVVVARLAARGLVARGDAPEDARRTEIRITPAGRSLLERAPDTAQERLVAALGAMPAGERTALAEALAALVRRAGVEHPSAAFFFEDDA